MINFAQCKVVNDDEHMGGGMEEYNIDAEDIL